MLTGDNSENAYLLEKAALLQFDIWLVVGGSSLLHRASSPKCFPGKFSIWGDMSKSYSTDSPLPTGSAWVSGC